MGQINVVTPICAAIVIKNHCLPILRVIKGIPCLHKHINGCKVIHMLLTGLNVININGIPNNLFLEGFRLCLVDSRDIWEHMTVLKAHIIDVEPPITHLRMRIGLEAPPARGVPQHRLWSASALGQVFVSTLFDSKCPHLQSCVLGNRRHRYLSANRVFRMGFNPIRSLTNIATPIGITVPIPIFQYHLVDFDYICGVVARNGGVTRIFHRFIIEFFVSLPRTIIID